MLGKIFGVLVVLSLVFGTALGNMQNVSQAALDGAINAVELSINMLGNMCLWSGCVSVIEKSGIGKVLEKLVLPIFKIIYPESYKKKNGISECVQSFSANFFGLSNAALPLGIEAVKKLKENDNLKSESASDEVILFTVLATTPFQLLPTTLATMRKACGSTSPYDVLLPIWICEILTTVFAIVLCRFLAKCWKRKESKNG